MFRDMRRKQQQLDQQECVQILKDASTGVLAVYGDDGYPYGVPLNFVYAERENKIYFHCATEGHKLDGIRRDDKVSFSVIGDDTVVPEKYTTYFSSVIIFGRAKVLEQEQETVEALRLLADKYVKDTPQKRDEEIRKAMGTVRMVEIAVEHMTGKECIELTKKTGRNLQ